MALNKLGAWKIAAGHAGLSLAEYTRRREAGLKRCTRCKAWKPVSEYGPDKFRDDGISAKCRTCHRVSVRRKRIRTNEPREAVQRAALILAWAIRNGHLPRASKGTCPCGKRAAQYHHHHGYTNHELDVIALCVGCHRREHWEHE